MHFVQSVLAVRINPPYPITEIPINAKLNIAPHYQNVKETSP